MPVNRAAAAVFISEALLPPEGARDSRAFVLVVRGKAGQVANEIFHVSGSDVENPQVLFARLWMWEGTMR